MYIYISDNETQSFTPPKIPKTKCPSHTLYISIPDPDPAHLESGTLGSAKTQIKSANHTHETHFTNWKNKDCRAVVRVGGEGGEG